MEWTRKSVWAGILTIISGCLGIGIGVAVVQGSSFLNWLLVEIWIGCVPVPLNTGCIASVIAVLATVFIVLGAIALIGGIFALRRRVWGFALAGAILSLPLIPFGTVLGILSIIFLSKSKNEFS